VKSSDERRRGRFDVQLPDERKLNERACHARQDASRVLLVDCLPDEQEIYTEYLNHAGFDPVVVCEASMAFEMATTLQPAIVVADWMIHHGGGLDLIRRLREDARTRTAAMILISSQVFPRHRAAAADAGCDAFLAKPFFPETLIATVRDAALAAAKRLAQD
jgi:DNA-binding response OmpR family regulator